MTALGKYFAETPTSDITPTKGSTALPSREYVISVEDITFRANDYGAEYLEFKFKVISPDEFKNRLFWDKFFLKNKSPKAVDFSRERLRQLSMCVLGREALDTKELLDKKFYGTTKIRVGGPKEGGGKWDDTNYVVKFRPLTSGIPPKGLPSVAVQPKREDVDPDLFNDEMPF